MPDTGGFKYPYYGYTCKVEDFSHLKFYSNASFYLRPADINGSFRRL